MTMKRILFCGGGSVGHLAPSLAVWQALRSKGEKVKELFICSSKFGDRSFLRSQRVSAMSIHAPKLKSIFFIFLFPIACMESLVILLWFRPHVIFAKGGYVSVPVAFIGWLLRIPIVLHESDSVLGKANSVLLRFAKHFCMGAPQKGLANEDVVVKRGLPVTATGNPIRKEILQGTADGGKRVTEFSGKRPVLLVIGGSQGAKVLNEALASAIDQLVDTCDIIHLTGRGKGSGRKSHARYFVHEFADEDLPHLYALADVVVSRAGAGTIAELSALGKATILIPLPDLAHKHQEENAHFLEVADAVIVLKQESLKNKLLPTIQSLLQDEAKRRHLGERLHTFSVPDAADRIANILLEEAKK